MQTIFRSSMLFILMTSFPVFSQAQPFCPFNGFYVGADIGEGLLLGKSDSTINTNFRFTEIDTNIGLNSSKNPVLKKTAFETGIFLGYGMSCENIYLGAEGFLDYSRKNAKHTETIFIPNLVFGGTAIDNYFQAQVLTLKIKPWTYGVDLRPGLLLSENSLLFLRLGLARHRLRFVSDLSGSYFFNFNLVILTGSDTIPGLAVQEQNKNVYAYRLGGGLEQWLCSCLALRAEYVYSHLRKIRQESNSTLTAASNVFGNTIATFATENHLKVRQHSLRLGLVYYW